MRRVKVVLAVLAMLVVSVANATPAMANHDWDGWWDDCNWVIVGWHWVPAPWGWSWDWTWVLVCEPSNDWSWDDNHDNWDDDDDDDDDGWDDDDKWRWDDDKW